MVTVIIVILSISIPHQIIYFPLTIFMFLIITIIIIDDTGPQVKEKQQKC